MTPRLSFRRRSEGEAGMHEQRIAYWKAFPEGVKALQELGHVVDNSGLEHSLLELVKLRASQLNGCAYCLDMHSKDARARGEDEQRLNVLAAWREAPFYSPRERAALGWCEALTLLPQTAVPRTRSTLTWSCSSRRRR